MMILVLDGKKPPVIKDNYRRPRVSRLLTKTINDSGAWVVAMMAIQLVSP
jgi:hypothetical protein